MRAPMMPAAFEYIDEALEIGVGIGMRVIDRMPDPGLRGEMDHFHKPVFGKQPVH